MQSGGRTAIYFSRWKLIAAGLAWTTLAVLGTVATVLVFWNVAQAGPHADANSAQESLLITSGAVGFGIFNLLKVRATLREVEEPALVLDDAGFSAPVSGIRYAEWSDVENVRYLGAFVTIGSRKLPGLYGLRLRFYSVPAGAAAGFLSGEVRIPTGTLSISGSELYYLFEGHLRAFESSRSYS